MSASLRTLVAPLYLLLCLLLGGSAQGIWRNAILGVIGVFLLAWAALRRPASKASRPARQLAWIAGIFLAWAAIQLVPLPFDLWASIGPRQGLAETLRLVGAGGQAMPLSVAPYESLASLLALIPALALYFSIERLHAYRASYLVAALLAGTLAGVLLGTFQVASPNPAQSPFYLYPDFNVGQATGFFANSNHMASLLLASLPFLGALARSVRAQENPAAGAIGLASAGIALVIVIGVALNGSLAAYLLLLPVAGASLLIAFDPSVRLRRVGAIAAGLALVVGVLALNATALGGDWRNAPADPNLSRAAIAKVTANAALDYMPFGSGLGTYRQVYESYEDPATIASTRSSHAHDDFLELALELGLPAIFLLLLFFYWWGRAAIDSWRSPDSSPYVRAAAVASAAILAHSIVEYPLRTAAISGVFAMCLAFLADRIKSDPAEPAALRPTRHLTID